MTKEATQSSQDRHKEPVRTRAGFNAVEQETLDSLNELGFDRPVEFIRKYGARRIDRALALLRAKPAGQINNPGGFIRYLVMSPHGLPPVAEKTIDKFAHQKYGDIFQR